MPTRFIEPSGAESITVYDGWGRPTAAHKPDPALGLMPESEPAIKMTYVDVQDGPYQRVRTETRDDDGSAARYRSTWSYTDPYGHTVVTIQQADPSAGDEGPYIVRGQVERDARGFVVKAYEPYFATVDPQSGAPPAAPTNVASSRMVHDAFGRLVETFGLEGEATSKIVRHAAWQETFDAADLAQGAMPHPLKAVWDGRGRPTLKQQVTHQGAAEDTVTTRMIYLPTGELKTLVRSHSAGSDLYTREMQHDSWGRLVQNAEPNTSTDFGTANMRAWRYLYNDSGDLVGTSDARGCGKNAHWDGAGRLLAEVYSPCLESQAEYGDNVTTYFVYDAPEQGQDAGANPAFFAGKLAAFYDRAQRTRYTYDGRGRTIAVARQLGVPNPDGLVIGGGGGISIEIGICIGCDAGAGADGGATPTPGGEYAPHWYKTAIAYDEADRVIAQTAGANVEELLGQQLTAGGLTANDLITTGYTARGIANQVAGSYGDLLTGKVADADGFVRQVTYGDTAGTVATYTPDTRRRLLSALVKRQSVAPTVLEDLRFEAYDAADNALRVTDGRIAAEWPDGAKPVTRQFGYDDLNQLRRVDYTHSTSGGDDKQVSPFAAETESDDTRPIPEGPQAKRVKWQTFDLDWQGNLTKTDDDAHAFHDRSMGTMTRGTATNGPNRVASASAANGSAQATYDAAGNLTALTLSKPGPDGDALDIEFSYAWNEVGQMIRAKREAIFGVPFDWGADFHYAYDATGRRVTKSVEDPRTLRRTFSSEVFSTLRLNNARYRFGDYERTAETETLYLVSNGTALGRVVYGDEDLPMVNGNRQHVYFTMSDPLGSTSVVVDKATSELVERVTYLGYGQADSDYRPERWQSFREDYRFTGKEDDVGVGLTYFGARYYVAALGQWASADPLTIHELGSDLNPYAYVMGSPQRLVDPNGLFSCSGTICISASGQGGDWIGWDWDPFGSPAGDAATPFFRRLGAIEGPKEPDWLVAKPRFEAIIHVGGEWEEGEGPVGSIDLTFVNKTWTEFAWLEDGTWDGDAGWEDVGRGRRAREYAEDDKSYKKWLADRPPQLLEAGIPTPAKLLAQVGLRVATARSTGKAGEQAVRSAYNIGRPKAIQVGTKTRIPDGIQGRTLSEVKNVKSLSFTEQLRDYAKFAQQNRMTFDLYVRGGANPTQLSGPLRGAVENGTINLLSIP